MSDFQTLKFDYYSVEGSQEIRYFGRAKRGADDSDPVWEIKQFGHVTLDDGNNYVDQLLVRTGVAWTDRDALDW